MNGMIPQIILLLTIVITGAWCVLVMLSSEDRHHAPWCFLFAFMNPWCIKCILRDPPSDRAISIGVGVVIYGLFFGVSAAVGHWYFGMNLWQLAHLGAGGVVGIIIGRLISLLFRRLRAWWKHRAEVPA